VELVLGRFGIPYKRAVYGYGDKKGPTALTGKKVLPVLSGLDGVQLKKEHQGWLVFANFLGFLQRFGIKNANIVTALLCLLFCFLFWSKCGV
jgi:hypothetical protein